MAEPVSVGVWACRKADVRPGERVLVTGAGPIGLLAGQVARAFGAARVTITDVSEFRLGVATRLGLDARPAGEPIRDVEGGELTLRPGSICVHGDTPGAVRIARQVRQALTAAGVELAPFAG